LLIFSVQLKEIAETAFNDLMTVRNGGKVNRDRKLKYLIADHNIARRTDQLARRAITVRIFLELCAKYTYDPHRHIAAAEEHIPRKRLRRPKPTLAFAAPDPDSA
jgi:hypothetical protein